MNKNQAISWAMKQKVLLERGKSIVAVLQNLALMLLLFQSWGVPKDLQITLGFLGILALWIIGWLDVNVFQAFQTEQDIVANLNPLLTRIDKNTKKDE